MASPSPASHAVKLTYGRRPAAEHRHVYFLLLFDPQRPRMPRYRRQFTLVVVNGRKVWPDCTTTTTVCNFLGF